MKTPATILFNALDGWPRAISRWGWIVALLAIVVLGGAVWRLYNEAGQPLAGDVTGGDTTIVNPVAGSPGIQRNAFDVCEDNKAEVVRYAGLPGVRNPRYDVHLETTEDALDPNNNPTGLKRDVIYDLTIPVGGTAESVAIDETRAGFTTVHRSEPLTDGLRQCLVKKATPAPEEIN
jgi:hypothetical protein